MVTAPNLVLHSCESETTTSPPAQRLGRRRIRRFAGFSVAVTSGLLLPPTASAVSNRSQVTLVQPVSGVATGVVTGVIPTPAGVVQPLVGQTVNTQVVIPAVPQTSVVITPRVAAGAGLPSDGPPIVVEAGDLDDESTPSVLVTLGASATAWKCPVAGAKFTNDWGQSRSGGRSHTGTDMLAPRGTPVIAPFAGTAVQKSSSRGGLSVYLKAPDGVQIFGAHLSSYGTAGKVKAGAIIGYVGNTGNASGAAPHLHIEVHPKKGAKTNPFPILKKVCG
jgi:peptidoglycan LD-endopeptidase LytH